MSTTRVDPWAKTELLEHDSGEDLSFGQRFPMYMQPAVMQGLLQMALLTNWKRRVQRELIGALRVRVSL